jgi:hypothetical protein
MFVFMHVVYHGRFSDPETALAARSKTDPECIRPRAPTLIESEARQSAKRPGSRCDARRCRNALRISGCQVRNSGPPQEFFAHEIYSPSPHRSEEAMASTRRQFLTAGTAPAAAVFAPRAHGQWQPSQRYPDPAIKILDPGFAKYGVNSAKVERLATGFAGARAPPDSATGATCSGATSPTTAS